MENSHNQVDLYDFKLASINKYSGICYSAGFNPKNIIAEQYKTREKILRFA